jgi:threonine/homoserine/homoserine lactone efflux protein
MPEKAAFLSFLVAALLLNLAPGPDMMYVLGRSVGQGRRAGIVSALGIFVGCLFHICAAALGLAALLRSSPLLFHFVRLAGAGYLVYLGINLLLHAKKSLEGVAVQQDDVRRIFLQGVITNVLNPKVAIFFVAFLPQFVNPQGSLFLQILVMGLIFDVGGTVVNLGVAVASGGLGDRLSRSQKLVAWQRRLTGALFVGLGLRLGLAGRE